MFFRPFDHSDYRNPAFVQALPLRSPVALMSDVLASTVPYTAILPSSPIESRLWTNSQMLTLSPPGENISVKEEGMDQMPSGSGGSNDEIEGVWSADIEQAFQEALRIYPPCGRRKIILSDEGKMYGRNELIARFIKIRTGKTRTRKQVSSHIQVLMRKQQRETGGSKDSLKQSSVSPVNLQHIKHELKHFAAATSASTAEPLAPSAPTASVAPPTPAAVAPPLQIKEEVIANLNQQIGKTLSTFSPSIYQPWATMLMNGDYKPMLTGFENQAPYMNLLTSSLAMSQKEIDTRPSTVSPPEGPLEGFQIESSKMTLCGFSAFVDVPDEGRTDIVQIPAVSEQNFEDIDIHIFNDKYPEQLFDLYKKGPKDAFFLVKCWANIDYEVEDKRNVFFGVDSTYQTDEKMDIMVNTTVCTFQKIAIEKEETYSPSLAANGKYVFQIKNSPFCEYMVNFISKMKLLDSKEARDKVLQHFAVYQIVLNKQTKETLLVIAFIFVIEPQTSGCSIFRLHDSTDAA